MTDGGGGSLGYLFELIQRFDHADESSVRFYYRKMHYVGPYPPIPWTIRLWRHGIILHFRCFITGGEDQQKMTKSANDEGRRVKGR